MTKTLTIWFSPDEKPVRIGVYQTRDVTIPKYEQYQLWNGLHWQNVVHDLFDAVERDSYRSLFQNNPWRGFTTNQEAGK